MRCQELCRRSLNMSAKNYMDKLFKEEPGPRDMICGFCPVPCLGMEGMEKGII